MLHTLHDKIQRVNDLITEYDEDEELNRSPNPALYDFVHKLKVILKADNNHITQKHGTKCFNSDPSANDIASASSLQIDVSHSNTNPKVIEALGNHVVLTKIFKCGTLLDLKNFRLINKQWKEIANSAIIQRRLWKLSINDKFIAGDDNSNRNEALIELNDCIEASGGSFPLTTVDFSNVDDYNFLKSPALLRFFALIGQSMKHVKFNNFGPLTVNDFQDLLVNKMPNVEHVDAGNIVFTNQVRRRTTPLVLPYLKTVRIVHHNDENEHKSDEPFKVLPYYKDLLLAATNLKEIQDFRVQLIDAVREAGKMDCIQKFNFSFEMKNFSALFTQFSSTEPKLTSLSPTPSPFGYEDEDDEEDFTLAPTLAQSLQRILISSKDTLKHL